MNILEGKEKLKETKDSFTEELSEAEQIQEAGEESDRIIKAMELDGLDSDTQETAREVTGNFSEAYNEAMEEVGEEVESTAETAEGHVEGLGENQEQVDRNAERYAEIAGISDLGKDAAETGESKMESDSRAYAELISENEEAMDSARERCKNMASHVSTFFKG